MASATPSESKKAALWEDFVDIFFEPSAVFKRRATDKFGIALLILTILAGVLFVLSQGALQSIADAEFSRRAAVVLRTNAQITSEQFAQSRPLIERISEINYVIAFPITAILTGIVLWIVGKLFEAKTSLEAALLIAAYAQAPRLLEQVSNTIQGLLVNPARLVSHYSVTLSLARFFDPDQANPLVLALFARVDLFTLWVTVLLGLGLYITGKIGKGSASIAAAMVWCIGVLPAFVSALSER
jgi:hypothetical protein